MQLPASNSLLLGLLFLILLGGTYFILKPSYEKFKIYDLATLEEEQVNLPIRSEWDAVRAAFSLEEVKSEIMTKYQYLASLESYEIYWTATAEKLIISELQRSQWHVVFRASIIPSYICDVLFTDTSILQNEALVVCGYELIK